MTVDTIALTPCTIGVMMATSHLLASKIVVALTVLMYVCRDVRMYGYLYVPCMLIMQ